MSFDVLEAEAKARLGRVLNEKWTLEELIGVGGMAAVYRARHRNDARAAVKLLHPALARNTQIRERFLREGYASNHVGHRGAVQVQDDDIVKGGEDDGTAYIVMELLEGESLEQRAGRSPPITEQEFLTIASGVLSVLEAAHANGVVHRDLKPENIFLARDPEDGNVRVKVLDFGLACLIDAQRTTGLGLALGTPSYMSPEQASGRSEEIDGRTDLFALGATGFRLLAQRRIHDVTDPVRLVGRMANEPAPPIRSVAPNVSEEVAAIIDRAIAFKREDRYPNAAAMRADVQAARDAVMPSSTRVVAAPRSSARSHEEIERAKDSSTKDVSTKDASSDTSMVDEAAYLPGRRRSRLPFLLFVIVAGLGVGYLARARPEEREAIMATVGALADAALATTASAEVDAEAPTVPEAIDAGDEDDAGATAGDEPDAASLPPHPHPLPPPHPTTVVAAPKRPPLKKPPAPAPTHPAPRKPR